MTDDQRQELKRCQWQMRVRVVLDEPDYYGEIGVHVPSLPGCVSQGRTEEEALENIQESLAGLLEEYQAIPWEPSGKIVPKERERWLVVRCTWEVDTWTSP